MKSSHQILHDINSCINSLEQGFFMLQNGQLEDEVLRSKLIDLMAEQSLKLKINWISFKELENISPPYSNS